MRQRESGGWTVADINWEDVWEEVDVDGRLEDLGSGRFVERQAGEKEKVMDTVEGRHRERGR